MIPAGCFCMGSPATEVGRLGTEQQHEVTLTHSFRMMEREVTQNEYVLLIGENPSRFSGTGRPVEQVFYHEAVAYAAAKNIQEGLPWCMGCEGGNGYVSCYLNHQYATPYECPGYRLPTEAEWEYAARAGSTTAWPTGDISDLMYADALGGISWYYGNSAFSSGVACETWFAGAYRCATQPVGGKLANAWGLRDMHGNVAEFVADRFKPFDSSPVTDPWCDEHQDPPMWVARGGSWLHIAAWCRSATRIPVHHEGKSASLGFRLVRTHTAGKTYQSHLRGAPINPEGDSDAVDSDLTDLIEQE